MIVSAGLTPAWQRILVFDRLGIGEVNRAVEAVECASGKVLNVGRACHALGAAVTTVCPAGGAAGSALRAEFDRDRIPTRWIETSAPSRVCTTLIDRESGAVTELVENAQPLTTDELEAFQRTFREVAAAAEIVVLTGSLPPRTPTDFYARLMERTAGRVLLDVRGPELQAALPLRPLLIKPNRAELTQTVGVELQTEADLLRAMRELNRCGAEWVLVTDGPRAVWLTSGTETCRFTPPPDVPTVNPIGCGDCLAAGIATGLAAGWPVPEAVVLGMAAAARNAAELLPARLERGLVNEWVSRVQTAPQVDSLPWEST